MPRSTNIRHISNAETRMRMVTKHGQRKRSVKEGHRLTGWHGPRGGEEGHRLTEWHGALELWEYLLRTWGWASLCNLKYTISTAWPDLNNTKLHLWDALASCPLGIVTLPKAHFGKENLWHDKKWVRSKWQELLLREGNCYKTHSSTQPRRESPVSWTKHPLSLTGVCYNVARHENNQTPCPCSDSLFPKHPSDCLTSQVPCLQGENVLVRMNQTSGLLDTYITHCKLMNWHSGFLCQSPVRCANMSRCSWARSTPRPLKFRPVDCRLWPKQGWKTTHSSLQSN